MILISDKTVSNSIDIPCNFAKTASTTKTLSLKHTVDKTTYSYTVTDTNSGDFFYTFNITFGDIPDGEYEYEVASNKGLLRIGTTFSQKIYNKNITYKTYGE